MKIIYSIFSVLFFSVISNVYAGYSVPSSAGGWSRDTVNGIVYTSTITDKVAIGQLTASTALDVVGTVTATGFSTTNGSVVVGNNSLTPTVLNINTTALTAGQFYNPNLADNGDLYLYFGKDNTTNGGVLQYHKTGNGLLSTNYVSLYNAGASNGGLFIRGSESNVGVNITSPTVRFEVREPTLGTVAMRVMIDNTGIAGTSFIQFTAANEAVVGSIDAVNDTTVAYNTFTGSHYTEVVGIKPELFTVLESIGEKFSKQEQCFKTKICNTKKSRHAIGVYGGKASNDNDMILCIGTGFIWVENSGENIEIGDYLCSGNISGCAMKQDDDILHNYTIAKTTRSIKWNTGELKRLISCTYHGG